MKRINILLLLLITKITFCNAQYNREKLTDILTGGNIKTWTVKSAGAMHTEKSYAFNKNLSVQVAKDKGAVQTDKWTLTSADNIRWFISIGTQKYEIIVSYDKSGKQYVKLTSQTGDKTSVYNETLLYPSK